MHVTGRDLLSADQVPGTFWVCQFALLVLTLPGAPGRGTAQPAGWREGPWEEGLAHEQTGRVPHRDARRGGRGRDASWARQRARGARAGRQGPSQPPRAGPWGLREGGGGK